MKRYSLLFTLIFSVIGCSALLAETPVPPASPEDTVITSDLFRLDQAQHQGIFTGQVVVVSKNFRLTARELTVFFSNGSSTTASSTPSGTPPGGKVERLLARGDVHIITDDRTADAAQADYIVADDKMVLTGTPQVSQGKDVITGTTITLYRSTNHLEVEGRSKVVLTEGLTGVSSTASPPGKQP